MPSRLLFEGGPTKPEDYPVKVGHIDPDSLRNALADFREMDELVWGSSEDRLLRQLYSQQRAPEELNDLVHSIRQLAPQSLGSASMSLTLAFDARTVRPGRRQRSGWHRDSKIHVNWFAGVASDIPTDFLVPDATGEYGWFVEECKGQDELLLELFTEDELYEAGFIKRFEPGDIVHHGPTVIHRSGKNTSSVAVDQVHAIIGVYEPGLL